MISLQKPRPRILDKRQAAKEKLANWQRVCRLVKARDLVCRVCKGPGNHVHHLVYRSHGGRDIPSNLILTCADCHADIHAKVTLVSFDARYPANTVTFERSQAWG